MQNMCVCVLCISVFEWKCWCARIHFAHRTQYTQRCGLCICVLIRDNVLRWKLTVENRCECNEASLIYHIPCVWGALPYWLLDEHYFRRETKRRWAGGGMRINSLSTFTCTQQYSTKLSIVRVAHFFQFMWFSCMSTYTHTHTNAHSCVLSKLCCESRNTNANIEGALKAGNRMIG